MAKQIIVRDAHLATPASGAVATNVTDQQPTARSPALTRRASNVVSLFGPQLASSGKKTDRDTIHALEQLLGLARAGEINGIAFAFSRPGMKYMTDITGFFYQHPTYARGAIDFLADQLAGIVHNRDEEDVR